VCARRGLTRLFLPGRRNRSTLSKSSRIASNFPPFFAFSVRRVPPPISKVAPRFPTARYVVEFCASSSREHSRIYLNPLYDPILFPSDPPPTLVSVTLPPTTVILRCSLVTLIPVDCTFSYRTPPGLRSLFRNWISFLILSPQFKLRDDCSASLRDFVDSASYQFPFVHRHSLFLTSKYSWYRTDSSSKYWKPIEPPFPTHLVIFSTFNRVFRISCLPRPPSASSNALVKFLSASPFDCVTPAERHSPPCVFFFLFVFLY